MNDCFLIGLCESSVSSPSVSARKCVFYLIVNLSSFSVSGNIDVDGVVFLDEAPEWVEAGMFVEVEITQVSNYALVGVVLSEGPV